MRLPFPTLAALLPILTPLATAQLHHYATLAGLKYFGAATDTPGQRERAGYEASYAQYDAIFSDPSEFGQTTLTNGQKWLFTEPSPGVFNLTEGDIVTSLAAKTGKLLRCHALVWHSQLAPWVEAKNETEWTKEELSAVIVRHIRGVMGHYKGKCYAWDVVNEALNDEDGGYRQSIFYKVLGEEYLRLAFATAAEVDPAAKLYYNDYGIERLASVKTEDARRLVKMLRDAGLRVDGVGMQAHMHADNHPTAEDLEETMRGYVKAGVQEVAFTELDVRITIPVNETSLEWQKDGYQKVARACVKVKECVGITLWDFYDPFSWIPYTFPGKGAGLLWFEDFGRHPAYQGIIDTFKELIKDKTGKCGRRLSRVRRATLPRGRA
ncbi:glycoside hydrolase superfamily [Neurospora tetraspora]|uniref:Beta-xylanase n=1 Tax=Neurospora tetraspora TaxID=94610 RepID=A0AAE0JL09_9PEZI|nr:glycoside hydrolase superfamily [Neurospora tetraspora]